MQDLIFCSASTMCALSGNFIQLSGEGFVNNSIQCFAKFVHAFRIQ